MAETPVASYRFSQVFREPKPAGRKTDIYSVRNRSSGNTIGWIKWYNAWRQFCFEPAGGTVWSDGCLADIRTFLKTI